jgi:ABC-type microcin C transport system permease subunit YejB
MGAYILRRLLLMIPTLFGIMVVNFALTQFVPGGPVEQVLAQLEGEGDVFAGISGGGNEGGGASEIEDSYQGARGLPPQFLDELQGAVQLRPHRLRRGVHRRARPRRRGMRGRGHPGASSASA